MKLIYRIALRLSLTLLPLLALWATLFYVIITAEINDEADDVLEDYSELIIIRMLTGQELPPPNDGSNNSYTVVPVTEAYAERTPHIAYLDAEVFIPEKEETEPARILKTIFRDRHGRFYELTVATPTFEKEDLMKTILIAVVALYLVLLLTVIGVTMWVFRRSLDPLYALLRWLDGYLPGHAVAPVPDDTSIAEFRKLNAAAQQAVTRSEELFERQKQFIGNASHELQTPLAILRNRIEWLLDRTPLSEEQTGELVKMQRTLNHAVRLNRTLLLLTKIDNGQFPESSDIDLARLLAEQTQQLEEIYRSRGLRLSLRIPERFTVRMNETLASTLVGNLLRNAFVHTAAGGRIEISLSDGVLTVRNEGTAPLQSDHIFDRFYRNSGNPDSVGLGLALVRAVCRYYALDIDYRFERSAHCFSVRWK
ncbi:MAG: HAMP domain-containing histidine kinase [Rikenellaceae bacterium]|nr:HAMP domain-containing histidine kinase [Rikenellaceae bacterium]